jgi:hypothetical protein
MAVQQSHVLVLHRHWMVDSSRWLPTGTVRQRRMHMHEAAVAPIISFRPTIRIMHQLQVRSS